MYMLGLDYIYFKVNMSQGDNNIICLPRNWEIFHQANQVVKFYRLATKIRPSTLTSSVPSSPCQSPSSFKPCVKFWKPHQIIQGEVPAMSKCQSWNFFTSTWRSARQSRFFSPGRISLHCLRIAWCLLHPPSSWLLPYLVSLSTACSRS